MKAIELYNIMKDYTEEELKEIDIVIEPNRVYKNGLTEAHYVDKIESMSNQIRLIHIDETKRRNNNPFLVDKETFEKIKKTPPISEEFLEECKEASKLFKNGDELLDKLNIKTKSVHSNENVQNDENFYI